MEFIEIYNQMVVHCKTGYQAKALFEHLSGLGYKWYNGDNLTHTEWKRFGTDTCYRLREARGSKEVFFDNIESYRIRHYDITEYEDLIIRGFPEQKTVDEILKFFEM